MARTTSRIREDQSCFTATLRALSWQAINFNHRRVHNSTRGYGKLSRRGSSLCVLREPELGRRGTILRRTLMYRRDEGGNNGRSSRSYWQEGCRKTGRHCSSRPASAVSADIKRFRGLERRDSLAFSVCHRGHAFNFAMLGITFFAGIIPYVKNQHIFARHFVLYPRLFQSPRLISSLIRVEMCDFAIYRQQLDF